MKIKKPMPTNLDKGVGLEPTKYDYSIIAKPVLYLLPLATKTIVPNQNF